MTVDLVNLKDLLSVHERLIEFLEQNDIPLICINERSGKNKKSRFSVLYRNNRTFWKAPHWDFYVPRENHDQIITLFEESIRKIKKEPERLEWDGAGKEEMTYEEAEVMGKQFSEVKKMSLDERHDRINQSILSLDEALEKGNLSSQDMAALMTDAAIYSTLINKVSIDELSRENDKLSQRALFQITQKSERLMSSFIEALSRNYNLNHTAEAITTQTEGGTARHMVRVFILSIRFLDYLKHQFEYAGLYRRLKGRMTSYFPLYEPLAKRYPFKEFSPKMILPFEPRFPGKTMEELMLGNLLHDLGKKKNLLYFDGNAGYDRGVIERHAFDGFFMLMKKTVYQHSIASVAGMHHEYYGHEKGYGVFRDTYGEFKSKDHNQAHRFDAVLTNDYNDIIGFRAVAFFPAKMLEIVDVYDALIDKDRQYKKAMSPLESLTFMRKEMIENNLQLDPILFDLFVKFMNQAKLL